MPQIPRRSHLIKINSRLTFPRSVPLSGFYRSVSIVDLLSGNLNGLLCIQPISIDFISSVVAGCRVLESVDSVSWDGVSAERNQGGPAGSWKPQGASPGGTYDARGIIQSNCMQQVPANETIAPSGLHYHYCSHTYICCFSMCQPFWLKCVINFVYQNNLRVTIVLIQYYSFASYCYIL